MKSKYALTLRPKHALWLLAALLGSTWYVTDPQARPGHAQPVNTPSSDRQPGLGLAVIHPADRPLVASTHP